MSVRARRIWWMPEPLITAARQKLERGVHIINLAGEALRRWCADGGFVVWRDPDWMSQSDAVQVAAGAGG